MFDQIPSSNAELQKAGADPAAPMGPPQTAAFLKREIERWAKVVKAANIRAE